MMSISMESRLPVFIWSMSELPPLNMKGQPERASASSNENARIVFSTRATSSGHCFAFRSSSSIIVNTGIPFRIYIHINILSNPVKVNKTAIPTGNWNKNKTSWLYKNNTTRTYSKWKNRIFWILWICQLSCLWKRIFALNKGY